MNTFSSPSGKQVLEDLQAQAFFEDSTFSGDVNRMLINEGARLLFLRIRDLALSPMPEGEDNSKENQV